MAPSWPRRLPGAISGLPGYSAWTGSGAEKETEPTGEGERRSRESRPLPDVPGLRIGGVVLAIALPSFAIYAQVLDHAFVDPVTGSPLGERSG